MNHPQNPIKMGRSHPPKPSPTHSTHELTQRSQTASPSSFATPQRYLVSSVSPPAEIEQISPPALPGTKTRWSELIDPEEYRIVREEEEAARIACKSPLSSRHSFPQSPQPQRMIESPSGNLLSAAEYQARQDRKLSIAERQEAIRDATQRKIAMEAEGGREEGQDGEGGKNNNIKCSALGGFLRTSACCGGREKGKGRGRED